MNQCSICEHDDQSRLEELGQKAALGEMSWSEAARQGGLANMKGLKNHMERHWADEVQAEREGRFQAMIQDTVRELEEMWRTAPPELKPLYLLQIKNVEGIDTTNVSQRHLMDALKAVREVTGMGLKQNIMLQYAQVAFGRDEEAPPALGQGGEGEPPVLDVESEEVKVPA